MSNEHTHEHDGHDHDHAFDHDEHINPSERVHKERRATWLELFFDLAYVAVIAQLTYFVGAHHSPGELGVFVVIFLAIFWLWWSTTAGSNINEEQSRFVTMMYQVHMFIALVMSMFIAGIFDGGATGFVIGLVSIRLIQVFLIARMYIMKPQMRPKTYNILTGYFISVLLWVGTIFVPAPLQFVLWAILVVYDYLVPQTKGKGNTVIMLNPTHLQERLGLFLLLVMGESVLVVAISSGLSDVLGEPGVGLIGLSGMLIMTALWWLYFPYFEEVAAGKHTKSLMMFIQSHALLFLAVILLAVGLKEFIGEIKKGEPEHINNFLVYSLGLIIVSFAFIKRAMGHFGKDCAVIAIVSLVALAGLYLLTQRFVTTAAVELFVLALLFVFYVKIEYHHTHTVHKVRGSKDVSYL